MDNTYSLSDLKAITDNADGFGGGSGAWILILLFAMIFGWGGGGFGGNNASNAATTADIQRAVDLNGLNQSINNAYAGVQNGQAGISADLQRGIYEINNNTNHVAYDNLGEIRDVQSAIATGNANIINNLTAMAANQQTCCCTTQRAIDNVNYNLATESAAIQANDTANTQKILDAIATNRMADMQNQINQLQLANAVSGVVRYPQASTYYAGTNPFCGSGCGNL